VKLLYGMMLHVPHTNSSAVAGIADMPGPGQNKTGGRLFSAIFLVLAGCVIVTGCLGAITFPGSNGQTHLAENEGKLSVYFLDVGQGDSTLFVYEGKTILIDAGEADVGDRVVSDLRSCNVTQIDLLVTTHPHSDHIGGMQKVLAAFPVGSVLDAGLPHPSPTYEHFLDTIEQEHIPYQVAGQGQVIKFDPAIRVFVLSPPKERAGDDPNDNSVVLRISYGAVDFLMTGDLDNAGEEALLKTRYPLDAEILKVGHHGSSSSTSPPFLARIHPETAIISAGVDNPYNHPNVETLDLLKQGGVKVYRTDLNGTIFIRTDGMSYSVKTGTHGSGIVPIPVSSRAARTPVPDFTLPTLPGDAIVPLQSITLPPFAANWTIPSLPPVPPIGNKSGVNALSHFADNWTIPSLPPAPQIGNATGVYINATQFDAPGDDRQNLNGEWIRLTNRGDDWVLLAGWTLSDSTGSHPYVFPAYILTPNSSVTVYSGRGTINDTALFMERDEPLWGNTGDLAILKDGSGHIIDQRYEGST
jgi:competence protein ComEC